MDEAYRINLATSFAGRDARKGAKVQTDFVAKLNAWQVKGKHGKPRQSGWPFIVVRCDGWPIAGDPDRHHARLVGRVLAG